VNDDISARMGSPDLSASNGKNDGDLRLAGMMVSGQGRP
jgi:hypothetical protein